MGLLKKVFKPVAKVLDKIVPNEIKPFLPYAAAFAPVFGPTAGIFGNTMMKRALLSGGANILGQLSQEGSEGDINLLSAGLGALTGAMTGPGAQGKFADMKFGERTFAEGIRGQPVLSGFDTSNVTGLQKAANVGLDALSKGSKIMAAGMKDPISMAGLKAAALPAATATGDVMQAQARQLEKQEAIDAALAEAEALADSGLRGDAIRNAMRAYGFFTDDEIESTVSSAGYRAGGRVGFDRGGLGALGRMMAPKDEETDMSNVLTIGDGIKVFIKDFENQPEITGKGMQGDGEGGMEEIFVLDDGSRITVRDYIEKYGMPQNFKKGGRVGFKFGGIDAAIDKVEDESIKESVKMVADMPDMDLMDLIEEFEITFKRKPMNMEELKQFYRENYEMESPVRMREKIKEKVTVEAKDGGLMNLGGKEMDLRGGGFVPIGKKERADDVPARLSKNEFVMTADAVRAAGGGNINKGAKRMYELMNNLEARV